MLRTALPVLVLAALAHGFWHGSDPSSANDDHHAASLSSLSSLAPSSSEPHSPHETAAAANNPSSSELPTIQGYIPDNLRQFIMQWAGEQDSWGLYPRQVAGAPGVAPGGGIAPGAVTQPTQMPTVTTFELSGKVIPYTQTFPPTPSPFAAPVDGTIGLGTLSGQVGVVKTTS